MSLYEEQFNNLTDDEKDAILEFIWSITEGDIITIGREMSMFNSDIKKLCNAIAKFQES